MDGLKKQRAKVQTEISRLVASIADGNTPQAIVDAIKDREAREKALAQEIARLEAAPALVSADLDLALKEIRRDLDAFGDILRESRPKAQVALGKVLDGRLTFQVEGDSSERCYRLVGTLKFGKLLDLSSKTNGAQNAPSFYAELVPAIASEQLPVSIAIKPTNVGALRLVLQRLMRTYRGRHSRDFHS